MIRKFISYYKPHIGLFSLDMFCAVAVALCNLYYPTLARKIINEYSQKSDFTPIIVGTLLLLAVYLIKALGTYIMGYYGHVIGIRMQKDMRRDLFNKYQKLPFSYFDDHKTGDLLSRLTGDLQNVSELAHHGPENLFLAVLMFVGACAGSTAGGLKISRVMIVVKNIFKEIKHVLRPNSISVVRSEGESVSEETLRGTANYLSIYFVLIILFTLIISLDGFGFETNVTAVITCINNVGPGLAGVGPASNFADYSLFSKGILSMIMLIGRLEIMPMMILLSPFAWKKR